MAVVAAVPIVTECSATLGQVAILFAARERWLPTRLVGWPPSEAPPRRRRPERPRAPRPSPGPAPHLQHAGSQTRPRTARVAAPRRPRMLHAGPHACCVHAATMRARHPPQRPPPLLKRPARPAASFSSAPVFLAVRVICRSLSRSNWSGGGAGEGPRGRSQLGSELAASRPCGMPNAAGLHRPPPSGSTEAACGLQPAARPPAAACARRMPRRLRACAPRTGCQGCFPTQSGWGGPVDAGWASADEGLACGDDSCRAQDTAARRCPCARCGAAARGTPCRPQRAPRSPQHPPLAVQPPPPPLPQHCPPKAPTPPRTLRRPLGALLFLAPLLAAVPVLVPPLVLALPSVLAALLCLPLCVLLKQALLPVLLIVLPHRRRDAGQHRHLAARQPRRWRGEREGHARRGQLARRAQRCHLGRVCPARRVAARLDAKPAGGQ